MDEQQQKDLIKKTKIKMWIGIILIIVVGLAIAVYFVFINPIEKDEGVVNTVINVDETRECTYTSNTCQEGYYCYHEVSGGLGHDGPLPIETIGGDQMCHKLCDVNADCATGESCVTEDISIEDYIEVVSFCKSGVDSNKVVSDNMVTDISEWLTYENKEYGFSLEYPSSWQNEYYKDYSPELIKNHIFGLKKTFTDRDGDFASYLIRVTDSDVKVNLQDWIRSSDTVMKEQEGANEIVDSNYTMYGSVNAFYVKRAIKVGGAAAEIYYLKRRNSIIEISKQWRVRTEYINDLTEIYKEFNELDTSITFY